MDEGKSIFTTASDSQATNTAATESFAPSDNRNSGIGQGSVFSPLAPPFQSRITEDLISMVNPQEPRAGDIAPSSSDIDEVLMNLRINSSDSLFEDPAEQSNHNFFMGSRSESVASAPGNIWSENSTPKNNEMFDNFEFFLKTLSSANTYASMLTREQLSVLQSIRPSLLFEFLQEVARIRTEKRMQRALPHECAFCKNNGENEENYSSHALKDWRGRVQCPVLRAFRCPRCGATGDRAHTIKYCPANENGMDRQGSLLRRRLSSNSFILGENGRTGYSAPSTPAQSPSATSAFNNSSFWSNFGVN
ncbi:jg1669 [Pararge aegeria aegeria]|uniref:Jg1669 protein n=2 Tax=Pararge aegeria TaxID=116150 RepID=A0A8S4RGF2_9NEOP|nr:jg1669 [Pararge aegeria aegeria]